MEKPSKKSAKLDPKHEEADELTSRHSTAYDEALAGEETDGGESVLGGVSREHSAETIAEMSKQPDGALPYEEAKKVDRRKP
jgi:hypothetical protein